MVNRGKGHRCPSCHKTWVCFVEYCKLDDHVDCEDCFIHKGRQKQQTTTKTPVKDEH